MNRTILTLWALAAATTAAHAAQRTLDEARLLAQQELTARLGHDIVLEAQPQRASQRHEVTSDTQTLPYYHFSEGNAFVIIAGSDLLPAVIGYGQGSDIDNSQPLPPNLQSWLDQVAEVEEYLEANPVAAMAQLNAMAATTAGREPIAPIMTCQWGQDHPYNSLCPMTGNERGVVGCVATALSQIAYTQKFPSQSYGQVSYNNIGQQIDADLEGVTYDYTLMHDKHYRANTTAEEDAEVAKLCYNMGIACMMQYGEMSGTISIAAHQGLVEHFGMTKAALLHRYYYSLDEWNEILQYQLTEGNPVFFSGQSSAGGHAFVLDGMDDRGYYHVNWGWEGYYDGYYDVSLLRTDGAGTGASENGGFYLSQEMIVNLCDPDKVTKWYNQLGTYRSYGYTSLDVINCAPQSRVMRGTKLTLSAYTVNNGCQQFRGNAGVLVMKDGELFAQEMGTKTYAADGSIATVNYRGDFGWVPGDTELAASYTVPDDIADGTYRLYLVVQPEGEDCVDIVHQHYYRHSYWTMTVEGETINISHPQIGMPMELDDWSTDDSMLTTGPCELTCHVTNTSDETLPVRFYLRLTSPKNKTMTDISAGGIFDEPVTIGAGESKELTFKFTALEAGEWTAKIYGAIMGLDTEAKIMIEQRKFWIEADATRAAELTLLEPPTLISESVTNGGELTMTLRVKNTGADYDGQMSIRLYSRSNSAADSYLKAEVKNESVQIAAKETKTITITGTIDIPSLTKNTALYARGFFLFGDEMKEIEGSKPTTVRIYAATGIAEVTADDTTEDLSQAEIYNLLGKRIALPASGQLRPGIYIINGRKRVIN